MQLLKYCFFCIFLSYRFSEVFIFYWNIVKVFCKRYMFRSSHQRCSMKKGVLRNFKKYTGKHLCQGLFFQKVAGLRLSNFIKKETPVQVFSCELCKISKYIFFTEHLWMAASICFGKSNSSDILYFCCSLLFSDIDNCLFNDSQFHLTLCFYNNFVKESIWSSSSELFLGKGVLKICSKFTWEHPCQKAVIDIAPWHGCSPANLLHIFRAPFPKNTSRATSPVSGSIPNDISKLIWNFLTK